METVERSEITDLVQVKPKDKNYHSNSIIDSRQEYSVLEKKMIYFAINQLDIRPENIQRDLFNDICFKIPVSAFGADYSFKTLKSAINKITNRSIIGGDSKKQHAFSLNPFPFAELKNGTVELVMYHKAVPLFIDLKTRGYTSYELDIALSLKSVYSQRLYELLGRFKDTGKWFVEIDRFKFLLGIDKEKSFNGPLANGRLKMIVLEPAMKELEDKTDIKFDYRLIKSGRKYVSIEFDIYTRKLLKYIETAEARESREQFLERIADAPELDQELFIIKAFATDYRGFTEIQKNRIRENDTFKLKFVEIHTSILSGELKVYKTPTHVMAAALHKLGWK